MAAIIFRILLQCIDELHKAIRFMQLVEENFKARIRDVLEEFFAGGFC